MPLSRTFAMAVAAVALASPSFAQTSPAPGPSGASGGGTTSGPAVNTPATMNAGGSGGMTASPHQKDVLRDKGKTPAQPDNAAPGTPRR